MWKYKLGVLLHVQEHHIDSVTEFCTCEKCGERFVTSHLLNNHNFYKHNDKEFACSHCGRIFKTKTLLLR